MPDKLKDIPVVPLHAIEEETLGESVDPPDEFSWYWRCPNCDIRVYERGESDQVNKCGGSVSKPKKISHCTACGSVVSLSPTLWFSS